jgi:hypothetical protein
MLWRVFGMSIQFLQEMINEVNRELSQMREFGFDRVRVLELGVIRIHLINKQCELYDEYDGEE